MGSTTRVQHGNAALLRVALLVDAAVFLAAALLNLGVQVPLGIAVGLSSARVQGAARGIHIVLVPLAIVVFALLLRTRPRHPSMRREDAAK